MGDVWPVPSGCEAASVLGTSPEQRNRSIPSGLRAPEASGCLSFPPYGRRLCGVSLCCVVSSCVVLSPVVLWCVEVYGVLWCVMWCVCVCVCVPPLSLFAQAVCYSKREPNIREYLGNIIPKN